MEDFNIEPHTREDCVPVLFLRDANYFIREADYPLQSAVYEMNVPSFSK